VLASGVARADDPVLHEHVVAPRGHGGRVVRPEGAASPTAIRQDQKILSQPSLTQPAGADEVVHGRKGFAADRQTEARPDYATRGDGTLHYSEVFNPSIVPFKRMSALDTVRDDESLTGAGRDLTAIAVGGEAAPDRDLFWGSLLVDLPSDGHPLPIPSVAPDMRVLSVEVAPPAKVSFARDGADNFYLSGEPGVTGPHRVVILVDAPAVYFAPQVPAGVTVGEVARRRPPLPMPEPVRASARLMLSRLGITPALPADRAVGRLVDYFRGFTPGAPPSPSGDVYLDLALSKKGVCRHRAYAFMITANAAGIPTRYVTNEAHAFAEIWLPGPGWLRVDLGGAALELDVANGEGKTLYRPRGDDPFPKPREYAENYTRLRGDISGLTGTQLAEGRGRAAAPGDGPAAAAGPDPRSTDPLPTRVERLPQRDPTVTPAPGKNALTLVVDSVEKAAFRGDQVHVVGHAGGAAGAPEGLPVAIYLAPAGSHGEGARLCGQTVTGAAGVFQLAVDLPADLALGQHEVFLVSPGDARYAPGVSE
jgi:hypothetical protein